LNLIRAEIMRREKDRRDEPTDSDLQKGGKKQEQMRKGEKRTSTGVPRRLESIGHEK